jgi:hypothetical protein
VIPATLLICDRRYAVTVQPMVNATGCCNNESQDITIDADAHPETQATVLLHEVLEAINASLNLGLKHHVISALETGLYGVLTTNEPWWRESA